MNGQTVFNIKLPNWIGRIEALDDSTITEYISDEKPEMPTPKPIKPKVCNVKNALYGMEIQYED